jgi:hypothetical protein
VTNPRLPSRIRQGLNVESSLSDGVCVPLLIIFLTVAQAEEAIGHVEAVKVVLEEIGIVAADQAEDAMFLGWFGPRGLASIVFVLILLADTRAGAPYAAATQRRCSSTWLTASPAAVRALPRLRARPGQADGRPVPGPLADPHPHQPPRPHRGQLHGPAARPRPPRTRRPTPQATHPAGGPGRL